MQLCRFWLEQSLWPTGEIGSLKPPSVANFREVFQQLPTERMVGSEDSSMTERLECLRGGFALWLSHTFIGAGLGSFISTQISKTGTPLIIHSTYVWIIAEVGILGSLLTGRIPMMQIKRIWSTWWHRPKRTLGGLDKNDSAIFLHVMLFCVFSLAHEVAYQGIFWFILGALLAGPGRTSIKSLWHGLYLKARRSSGHLQANVKV